jgi:hypothetical protein
VIRPTAAFCVAALAAIGLALGAGYTLYPAQGDAAKLSVAEPPRTAATVDRSEEKLHVVREHPMKEGQLVSPFLPEHPTREQVRAEKAASAQRQKMRESHPEPPPPQREMEIRLVGVASAGTERRAILAVGKRQILLAPGEEKGGVTLVSLTENSATVSTAAGMRELPLSLGITK